ncbi:MAG TPA: IS110 family transposase [Acidimicrobiales bacterium]|nr:IS110 family transposase [Acidimicrobiales bacterium]
MRSIGLDIHRDFCEVAILEDGALTRHRRVPARRAHLESFAQSLRPTDQVGLEATGNALAIARLIETHVARVLVANAAVTKGIGAARAKTDQLDARMLAQLLGTGFFPQVWLAEEPTRLARRRMSRRAQLVRERTGLKNQVHAVLHRNLVERPPASDLFGLKGLRWLATVELPEDEEETVRSCLRQLSFLGDELERLDKVIARSALENSAVRLLLTVPGVNLTTAAAFTAAVGDIARFKSPRQLVSYLGLDPTVHQSGMSPARHGSISKQGCANARWALVESAWVVARPPGPLHAFAERVRARRGVNVATVAVARKLVVLFWHMLTTNQEYAFGRPSLTVEKLRRAELTAGAPTTRGKRSGGRVYASAEQRCREQQVAVRAETAYRQFVTQPRNFAKTT